MKKVGIIGAMPSELADIIAKYSNAEIKGISGFEYHIKNLENVQLIFACSGIAKVNSALCTQVLIDNFKPDAIINTGIAGGMDGRIKVCDIVISENVMYHDLDHHFLDDYPPYCGDFPADGKLIKLAEETCRKQGRKYFVGNIVSGEIFVTDSAKKRVIRTQFSPLAVDMETAAIGHCCYLNDIPFVSVRCISDNADDDGAMSFDIFEKKAAGIVAAIVIDMAENL